MLLERKPTITPTRRQLEQLRAKPNLPKRRVAIEVAKENALNLGNIRSRFLRLIPDFRDAKLAKDHKALLGYSKKKLVFALGSFIDQNNNIIFLAAKVRRDLNRSSLSKALVSETPDVYAA